MATDQIAAIRAALPGYAYNDCLKAVSRLRHAQPEGKQLRVAVLRSYTIEAIEPVLELRLRLEGYAPEFFFGGYDQYVQEILDPGSAFYRFEPDVVLLCLRVEELDPDFANAFGETDADWPARMTVKANEIASLVETLRANSKAQVLVQNLIAPVDAYWGIYDAQLAGGQFHSAGVFNRVLADRLGNIAGAFVWDFCRFVQRKGYEQIFDPKMFYLSKSPYKQRILPNLGDDLITHFLSMLGRIRKCVVLDLDNTLWGGVVGEDGIDGIRLGHAYPGLCYREFQKNLLKLYHRGVILAINSKNNEADALRVIDEHPDMVLRREHFAAMQINWVDKASNLRALASTLNIGLDSMIMIDDSPAECELVRGSVPECEVVCLPQHPYLIPAVAERLPGIDNIRLTDEDRKKGTMYQAQAERARHAESFSNLDEFLASLELEVTIEEATPFSIPRIAQLSQKTNQFNVTTRRYTEADIAAMASSGDMLVYSVAVRDKFGDNGIVGVVIIRFDADECRIDTLLLSCRVIGRNVEASMVAHVAKEARSRGAKTLIGEFLPTTKNVPAADLFHRLGFEPVSDTLFSLKLADHALEVPEYIRLSKSA